MRLNDDIKKAIEDAAKYKDSPVDFVTVLVNLWSAGHKTGYDTGFQDGIGTEKGRGLSIFGNHNEK